MNDGDEGPLASSKRSHPAAWRLVQSRAFSLEGAAFKFGTICMLPCAAGWDCSTLAGTTAC